MDMTLPRMTRLPLPLTAAVIALAAACGGGEGQGAASDTAGTPTVGAAAGDVNASGSVNPEEAVAFMAAADQSEVQAAQVAENKATNREVREFAQLMQREHSRSSHEIGELAKRMNINLEGSARQGQMVTSLQQMAQQMSQQLTTTPKGAEFDRVYMNGQVQAHQTVLENLQRIAGGSGAAAGAPATPPGGAGQDTTRGAASPQQAAQMMIPKVQQHLERARQIQGRLGGATG